MAKILDLGSGSQPFKSPGDYVIHLDQAEGPGVDVIFDLNTTGKLFGLKKLPFADGVFDWIRAFDVIEHIIDVFSLMEELHRILMINGLLKIHTTHYKTAQSFNDPSHYHFFTKDSFDYWDPYTFFGIKYPNYTKGKFKVIDRREDGQELYFVLRKI